jgi:ribosomal L10-like protein
MSKEVKQMEFTALERTFSGVRDLVLLSPSKIDSGTEYNFRKQLREKKVRVQMVKNSLARRVFEAQGVKLDDKVWAGTTLVAWGADSIKDLSKAVDGLIKDIEKKDLVDRGGPDRAGRPSGRSDRHDRRPEGRGRPGAGRLAARGPAITRSYYARRLLQRHRP